MLFVSSEPSGLFWQVALMYENISLSCAEVTIYIWKLIFSTAFLFNFLYDEPKLFILLNDAMG